MLYISTKQDNNVITNIDDLFLLRYDDIKKKALQNKDIIYILQKIEGMKSYQNDIIQAKFGAVSLKDISMGVKSCILAILYSNEYTISTDEMGYNCIFALAEVSKSTNIRVYSSVSYTDFLDNIEVIIDNYKCHSKSDVIDTMEALYD